MNVVPRALRRLRLGPAGLVAVVLAVTASMLVSPLGLTSASAATSPPDVSGPTNPLLRPDPPLPATFMSVSVSPISGSKVGIASPLTAHFSSPVTRRAEAEHHMPVFVNGVFSAGAWFWMNASTAVFRTRGFWPAHARIEVRMSLRGVELAATTTRRFVVGPSGTHLYTLLTARSLVASVNAITHRMTIRIDGTIVKTFKVSLGRPGVETRSGIKAVMEKDLLRHMTSVAAGITDPRDQYDLQVPYAVRITPSGEFVHGAPWATARIGVRNGSHGCTNLFLADSKWFFDHVVPGDAVVMTGTVRPMEFWNGPGAPYNIPWAQWLAGSALKGAR